MDVTSASRCLTPTTLAVSLDSADDLELSGSITALGRSAFTHDWATVLDRSFYSYDFFSYDEACVAFQNALTPVHGLSRRSSNAEDMDTILRWDGILREATPWDYLKKDPELFDKAGDVAVHFHHKAHSRHRPSLRVSRQSIISAGCARLLDTHCYGTYSMSSSSVSLVSASDKSGTVDSGYASGGSDDSITDLYFPAPFMLSREEALEYHLTTRNLFAWMQDKPLVGTSLGTAMSNLLERMLQVRSATESNLAGCVTYAERMGYMDMLNQPNHALAMLAFAEHAGCQDIRNDAFVHCVGMHDMLAASSELLHLSKDSRAAIDQQTAAMQSKIYSVVDDLRGFFEQETSPERLGLTTPQRNHLEKFRSFLRSFYINRYGYWPPQQISKHVFDDLRQDFEKLYDLLAQDPAPEKPAPAVLIPGLRAMQSITTFDERHGYSPLPSSLPLLPPNASVDGRSVGNKKKFFQSASAHRAEEARHQLDLIKAVNRSVSIVPGSLAAAYLGFERDSLLQLDPALTIGDARKVRWLQIYITLQTLRSVTESSLHDKLSTSYYTCCTAPKPTLRPKSALRVHPAMRASIIPDVDADTVAHIDPLRVPKRRSSLRRHSSMLLPTRSKATVRHARSISAPMLLAAFEPDATEVVATAAMAEFAAELRRSDSLSSHGSAPSVTSSVYSRSAAAASTEMIAHATPSVTETSVRSPSPSDSSRPVSRTASTTASSVPTSPMTPDTPLSPAGEDKLWDRK